MLGVMVVICAIDLLFGVLELTGDISDNFTFGDVLFSALLQVPARFVEFASVATLIGAMVALGIKASNAELVVLRAAGWSQMRILVPAMVAAIVMASTSLLFAEYVVPRTSALKVSLGQVESEPVWIRDADTFLKVEAVNPNGHLLGLTLIEMREGLLHRVRQAESATYSKDGVWILVNVASTTLEGSRIQGRQVPREVWSPQATPEEFIAIARPPEALAISELVQFIQYRRAQNLDVRWYTLAFWKTMLQPLANVIMVFLASSLIFGSMRMVSMGYRLTIGLLFGLGFYYAQDLFGFLSLVYGWHPLVTLSMPLFGFSFLAWRRFR